MRKHQTSFWLAVQYVAVQLILNYSVWVKRKCVSMKDTYEKQELAFLIFPSAVGVVLCLLLRSIIYSVRGEDIYLLVNSNPEMNVLIPGICVLCIGMMIFAARLLQRLRKESNKRIELSVYQNRIREMEQHMQEMERLYNGIRGMKHDMKNYIADMDALMKQEKESGTIQGALRQYLDSLQHSMEQLDIKYHTGNPVTDVVIQRYVALAKEHQIEFFTEFIFPKDMNIDAFDISIILNNGLENALEACQGQDSGEKRIELTSYGKENMFFIVIRNSFQGQLVKREDKILSTKEDSINHGLGLENIKASAQKYFGTASTTVEGGYFELAVMLQKRESFLYTLNRSRD